MSGIGGEARADLAHRVGVGAIVGRAVIRGARVARREGVDQRALPWRCGARQRLRLLHELEGVRLVVGLHQRVDVRAEHERLSPVGHGQAGVEAGRLAKGSSRLGVVEGIREVETLVDEPLGACLGGAHPEGVNAEILEPRGQFAIWTWSCGLFGLGVVFVRPGVGGLRCLGERGRRRQQEQGQAREAKDRGRHGNLLLGPGQAAAAPSRRRATRVVAIGQG